MASAGNYRSEVTLMSQSGMECRARTGDNLSKIRLNKRIPSLLRPGKGTRRVLVNDGERHWKG